MIPGYPTPPVEGVAPVESKRSQVEAVHLEHLPMWHSQQDYIIL